MRINEIFYSLQGEGYFTGQAAVFIRMSGCDLRCPFCDTDHSAAVEMTDDEILAAIANHKSRHVVITGGEPALQLTRSFVDALKASGYFIQVETNGTHPLPPGIDWVTCSPKYRPVAHSEVDELKVVYEGRQSEPIAEELASRISARHYSLQPCDWGDAAQNAVTTADCIEFIKREPRWRLSLQTHKLLNIR